MKPQKARSASGAANATSPAVIDDVGKPSGSGLQGVTYHICMKAADGGSISSDVSQDMIDEIMNDPDHYNDCSITTDDGRYYSLRNMLCAAQEQAEKSAATEASDGVGEAVRQSIIDTPTSLELSLQLIQDARRSRSEDGDASAPERTDDAQDAPARNDKVVVSAKTDTSEVITSSDGFVELSIFMN